MHSGCKLLLGEVSLILDCCLSSSAFLFKAYYVTGVGVPFLPTHPRTPPQYVYLDTFG